MIQTFKFDPAELDREITFLRREIVTDDYGHETETTVQSITVMAKLKSIESKEEFVNDRFIVVQVFEFWIYYLGDLTETWDLMYKNQEYEILGIQELGREWLHKIRVRKIS